MEFVDIHTHILPEVDDGARTFEEALLMIEEARETGVRKMLLTPHVSLDGKLDVLERIAAQYLQLQAMAAVKVTGIELHLGAELMVHPDLPELVNREKRLTLNGLGKYMLLEMPMSEIPFYAFDVCFDILTKGVRLIWAHPERCADVIRDYRIIKGYVDNGVSIQIDAASLTGLNGRKIKQTAETIVKKGMAHMLASDAHRSGDIKEMLPEAFLRVKRLAGHQRAAEMCVSAPSAVLN